MQDRAAEAPDSCALETRFESLINWIITQAIEFPSGQICPSLPDGASQLVREMGPWDGVGLEVRRGSAFPKCPCPPALAPASLTSFQGGEILVVEPKRNTKDRPRHSSLTLQQEFPRSGGAGQGAGAVQPGVCRGDGTRCASALGVLTSPASFSLGTVGYKAQTNPSHPC